MSLVTTTPMSHPVQPAEMPLPAWLETRVNELQRKSKAPNTLRAYRSDLLNFAAWCDGQSRQHLPASPETVAAYVADLAGVLRVATLCRRVAAISAAHTLANLDNPCRHPIVTATLSGLRRENTEPQKQAGGLLAADLVTILGGIGLDTLPALRDRALLLVGWCAALRRSELTALTWGKVERRANGVVLHIMQSKTDKAGEGQIVGLAADSSGRCPVGALFAYRDALANMDRALVADNAPVFVQFNRWGQAGGLLSGQAVGMVLQRRAAAAGLGRHFSGHSLRVGLIQQCVLNGIEDSRVMATTRHKGVAMLRKYQGQAGLIEQAAHKGLLA